LGRRVRVGHAAQPFSASSSVRFML
jgi:hypothetical protein